MSILFDDKVLPDLLKLYRDKKLQKQLDRLMIELERDPFGSFGKAEPLKGDRTGQWSRRIDDYHRLVYQVGDGVVKIVECGEHYSN